MDKWTDADVEALRRLIGEQRSFADIAKAIGRTPGAVARKSQLLGLRKPTAGRPPWNDEESRAASTLDWTMFRRLYPERSFDAYHSRRHRIDIPGLELVDYTAQVEDVEGDAVVCACVHVPQTDPIMWNRALAIGERDKIENLIIAGDIVTADMFSHWQTKEEWSFDKELESLFLHLRAALGVFKFVYITPGNHVTNRIVRISNGHIKLKHLIDMAGLSDPERARIFTTDIDFLALYSGDQRFLIGHASNYSRIDGRVALQYAEKEESHVISGNGHRGGYQISRSGRWHAWELGTMANPAYMGYANRSLTSFPKMLQNFITVRGGAVRIYGSGLPATDWVAELGHDRPRTTPSRK